MAVGERMPETTLNSRILQEINGQHTISRSTRKRNSLEFWGVKLGLGIPNNNQQSTSFHPQSLDKLPELRWQQDTPVQHLQKTSKHVLILFNFPKPFPPSSWRSMQKTNLQKVTQVNHPGPSACTSHQVGCMESAHLPKATFRGKSASWAPSNGEPGEWTCMISRGWGVFLVLEIWRNRKLRFFFCSDT